MWKKLAREVALDIKIFRLLLLLSLFDFTSESTLGIGERQYSIVEANVIVTKSYNFNINISGSFKFGYRQVKSACICFSSFWPFTQRNLFSKSLQEDFTLEHHTEITARMYCSSPFQMEKQSFFVPLCPTVLES